MESKAKGWAPERERHSWLDSGAGGVRGGLVQAASRRKRAKGAPVPRPTVKKLLGVGGGRHPGRAGGNGGNRDGDGAPPPGLHPLRPGRLLAVPLAR